MPDGLVLEPAAARSAVDGTLADLVGRVAEWAAPLVVPSSAIGEDGAAASFAGQHVTRLGVRATEGALRAAIGAVVASAGSPHALAYRRTMDPGSIATGPVPIAVLIQPLIAADVSGVLFTRNPLTGADELVIEAARGLGEAVVSGRVIPETCRMTRTGTVLEHLPGRQAVAVVAVSAGGTEERPVDPSAGTPLTANLLADLAGMAARCRAVFEADALDLEWAMSKRGVFLLQCRPVTARPAA